MSSALELRKMKSKNFPLDLTMLRVTEDLEESSFHKGGVLCILQQ